MKHRKTKKVTHKKVTKKTRKPVRKTKKPVRRTKKATKSKCRKKR